MLPTIPVNLRPNIVLLLSFCLTFFAADTGVGSDEEIALIAKSMPGPVAAKRKHRVLCYSKPWGYRHSSIPIGKKMIQVMADRTGLFEVTFNDELSAFAPDSLEKFDAICLNNTTHLHKGFKDEALRNGLIDFVKRGGGLFAIHAATDGGWPEYTEMIGGNFDGHPWGHNGIWSIANEDPNHPIVRRVFGGKPFLISDELYQYKDFDRSKVRVLLSLNMASFRNQSRGGKRSDNDYALAWVKQFGEGRVFVSALGHNEAIFHNPEILKMWVEGFRFVLGESDADTASKSKPPHVRTDAGDKQAEGRLRSPAQSLAEIELPDGYSLELVASEPMVSEPTLCTWDGNGRMYVAEMRTYMQDIDGTGTKNRVSQVVRLEDTDGDGVMDRRSVFAKDLLLPRLVLPLDDRVLIGETDSNDIHVYRDTDGDGVADEKKLWYEGGRRGGNLEHQPSGLLWSMDNWIYTTYNDYQLRFTDGKVVKRTTRRNGGQWGLTQDNYGKVIFVDAGAGKGPVHVQFPNIYSTWHPKWSHEEGFRQVYPIDTIADAQGGWGAMTPEARLKGFTATCGQSVFRGDRLPADLQGDLIFAEPVGRLLRRAEFDVDPMGRRILRNVYPGKEFLRSTDANFRPVNSATGPDGTLYLVDMHRGIIQEGAWVPEGSFIRKAIEWYGLDENIQRGRIYRLRHKDFKPGPKPNMLNESAVQLTAHLSHPNGWWRDEAQKLIILNGDRSVIPRLKKIATSDDFALARLHALWTLEGLNAIDMNFLKTMFKDADPGVKAAAIRISEPFFHADLGQLAHLKPLIDDPHHDVSIQLLLSMSTLVTRETRAMADAVTTRHATNTFLKEIDEELNQEYYTKIRQEQALATLAKEERELMIYGGEQYQVLCLACHGADGRGAPNPIDPKTTLAPSFLNNAHVLGSKEVVTRIVLHGMTGPVNGKTYQAGMMLALKDYDDRYLASVLTYIRNTWGNQAEMVTPQDVARIRRATLMRTTPYTENELDSLLLHLDCPPERWKMTASHRSDDAILLSDDDEKTRWRSHHEMKGEMWIEAEFPHARELNYILLDAKHDIDFPDKLRIEFSADGKSWNKKIDADGQRKFELKFARTAAKKVRISVAEDKKKWWTISDLDISGPTESSVEKYDLKRRVYLKVTDATKAKQGWRTPMQNKSVLGHPLRIAKQVFERGIGTHSAAEIVYELEGKGYRRFYSKCGPQGDRGKTVMTFELHLDGEKVFDTGDMKAGDPARYVDVDVTNAKELKLIVTPGSDGETKQDHANWVDACFVK